MKYIAELLIIAIIAGFTTWTTCIVYSLSYQRDHAVIKRVAQEAKETNIKNNCCGGGFDCRCDRCECCIACPSDQRSKAQVKK